MRKFLRLLCLAVTISAILLSGTLLTSCSPGTTIYVYNWGDYIDEDVLKSFTKETGIRVNYSTFARNEDMYTRLVSGANSYDVIFPSDYMISKLIAEDLIEKLDFGNIPNFSNIDERFVDLHYDPTNEYSVPYMWGTMGILYNTTMVDEEVDSWDILWNEKYRRQIFMYESMRDVFVAPQKRLGFSVNDTNIDNLNAVKRSLSEQKPLVLAYVDDIIKDKMIGNEAALAMMFSGDAFYCIEENEDLAFSVPKEGSAVWYDAMVIPKGSRNKKEAEMFIDYLCRPDIALKNTEYIGYSTTNAEAFKLLPQEWRDDPVYWAPDDVLARCEIMLDLGVFTQEYDRAWVEILIS